MQKVLYIISVSLALVLEWVLARMPYPVGFSPPVVVAVLIFWWWQKPLFTRLLAGAVVGFLLDSLSLFPFGTYLIVITVAAFLSGMMGSLFSRPYEFLPRSIGMASLLFFVIFFISPLARLIGWLKGGTFYFTAMEMVSITYGALFWSIVLSLAAVILTRLRRSSLNSFS